MKFTKMHGIGNDYVYVDGFAQTVDDPPAVARAISDRHFGVGGDGLILILPPEAGVDADVRMRMFNADGSESEMCGNGIRCVAKYAHDHGLTRAKPMRVQTGNGVLSIDYATNGDGKIATATVDMGEPILDLPRVPVNANHVLPGAGPHDHRLAVNYVPGNAATQIVHATFVSMGNPHAVIYVPRFELDFSKAGPILEHHAAFPRRMNIHWVIVHSPTEVTVKHWERGSGPTLACGTGACAVCVAGVLTGRTERRITAHLPGGDLQLEWREADATAGGSGGNHVYMTGPATEVFTGEWPG